MTQHLQTPEIKRMLQVIFPSPTDGKDAEPAKYWVIPGKDGYPRWILPQDPKVGMAGLAYWEPYDLLSRIKWHIILQSYKAGMLHHLPGAQSLSIPINPENNWAHLGWQQDYPPVPVIYIGSSSQKNKAVIFLVDTKQFQCKAVAKVPIGSSASRKILQEASALDALKSDCPGLAPHILFCNTEQGIAAQEVLKGTTMGRNFEMRHITWLHRLEQGETTLAAYAQQLWKRFSSLTHQLQTEKEVNLERLLLQIDDTTTLQACRTHGDFAPWNLKQLPNGDLVGIDWEASMSLGLPLQDIAHYFFIQDYIKGTPGKAWEHMLKHTMVQIYLTDRKLSIPIARKLYTSFLLDYWCCRLEDGDLQLADNFYQNALLGWEPRT